MTSRKKKSAVVTGGSMGIGYAIAETLLTAGYDVLICGRNREQVEASVKELEKLGKAVGFVCDVRDEKQVEEMISRAAAFFGGVDVLVNNAGIGVFGKTVEELSGDEFRSVVETNLFGVFYACHHVIPVMKKNGSGYIINISSLAGQNAHPKMAAYNASKFGLNGLSEALMLEVRQDNIKVSYLCPGSVNTSFGNDTPSPEKAWQIQPEDIAAVLLDLLKMDPRTLPSKVEIRPSKPPVR